MKGLLRDHDTRHLLGAQWLAQISDGLVQASFANVLILEPEGTVGRILGVSALTLLPYSLIAPFMGVFVDRWRRRSVLIGTNIARAVLLTGLAIVARLTSNELPLYAGLLALLGLGRLFLTTKGAVLPFVLHEHNLLKGNSLSGGGGMIAALLGGVIGIGSVAALDTANTFFVAASLYVLSSLVAKRITHPMGHPVSTRGSFADEMKKVLYDMRAGVREVSRNTAARLPLIGVFVVRVAAMVAAIAAIIVIKDNFPDAGDRFGRLSSSALALGAAGVGAFVGALIAPLLNRRFDEPRLMLGGFALAGIGISAVGGVPEIWAVLVLVFLGGLGGFIAKVAVDAQLQRALPDGFRGRGFAIYDVLYNLATVVAALTLLTAGGLDLRLFLIGVGIACLAAATALAIALARAGLLPDAKDHQPSL